MYNSNEKVMLLPQCETLEALESIEEIVGIDGIDGIFVGPFDLSISMGIPGQFETPQFQKAVDRVLEACKDADKPCMIFTGSVEEAEIYIKKGFHAVANGIDTDIFMNAYRAMVEAIRG